MNPYINGKIYAIMSNQTDKIYIGSTIQPLYKRFGQHKGYNSGCTSREITKYDDTYIQIIRVYPCNSRSDLELMEKYYIEKYKDIVVNKSIAFRYGGKPLSEITTPTPRISRYETNGPHRLYNLLSQINKEDKYHQIIEGLHSPIHIYG